MLPPSRLLVCLAAALPAAALAAPPPGPGGKPAGLPVKAVAAKTGTAIRSLAAVGNLLAEEAVTIRPEIAGRVTAIHFREGQKVAAGAPLVTLEAAEYRARETESAAAARVARLRHERASELLARGFISQQALDDAAAARAQAEARAAEDRARAGKTVLSAPFAGVVGLRQVSPGAYLQPGQDIVRLENLASLKLDFRVPETELARVAPGQEARVEVDAHPGSTFTGKVYAIEPAVDPGSRSALVRARVANADGRLRPGMFARVALVLEKRPGALLLPEQAIVPRGGDSFVFRVIDGKAALTRVRLGLRSVGEVELSEGVAAGELVVTDGQIKLRDGAPVSVMGATPPAGKP